MKTPIIILSILFLTACSHWTGAEKALLGSFAVSQGIGAQHTDHANNNHGIHETNNVYDGKNPYLLKGICVLTAWVIADLLPSDGCWLTRQRFLWLANGVGWGFVFKDQSVIDGNR